MEKNILKNVEISLLKAKKRNLKNSELLQVYLPKKLLNYLDRICNKNKISRSEAIRIILTDMLNSEKNS